MRILIADDHPDQIVFLSEALTAQGHSVETVLNGMAAVEIARASREARRPFHVIILDLLMPGLDGIQVGRELSLAGDKAALVFITGYAATAANLPKEAEALNAVAVLDKPVEMHHIEELLLKIQDRFRNALGASVGEDPTQGIGTTLTRRHTPSNTGRYESGNSLGSETGALVRRTPGPIRSPSGLHGLSGGTGRTPSGLTHTTTARIRRSVGGTDRIARLSEERSEAQETVDARSVECPICHGACMVANRRESYATVCVHCGQLMRIDPV